MSLRFLVQCILITIIECQDRCCTHSEVRVFGKLTVVLLPFEESGEEAVIVLCAPCYTLGGTGC